MFFSIIALKAPTSYYICIALYDIHLPAGYPEVQKMHQQIVYIKDA